MWAGLWCQRARRAEDCAPYLGLRGARRLGAREAGVAVFFSVLTCAREARAIRGKVGWRE
jgi:hypothetical protein